MSLPLLNKLMSMLRYEYSLKRLLIDLDSSVIPGSITMRGLVFVILAATVVVSVQGTRYRGPRFINLGITGLLAPVYAGYNRDTLSRFGSISGSSLSRTFDSTFLASGVTGGQSIGLSSVYPYTRRSTTIRTVAPFSGGYQFYNEFGGLPSVPSDGPSNFDGPLSGFGPGGSDLGPLGSDGPLPGNSVGGPLDGLGPNNGLGPDVGPGLYDGIGPVDGPDPYDYLGPPNGLGPLGGDGPLSGDLPDTGDGLLTGRFSDLGPLSGGGISGGLYEPLGYDYEASLGRSGAGSVYEPYRRLNGLAPLYPNPYARLDGRVDLGDRFSSSGFSSSSRTYNFPFDPYTASRSGRAYDLDSRGGYEYSYNDHPGVSSFGGDFSVSGGGPRLDFNLGGGDGLGFSTQLDALEGQGALGRGTGSTGLAESLGPLGPNLAYN